MPASRSRWLLVAGALASALLAPPAAAEPTPLSCVDESLEPWALVVTIDVPGTTGTYVVVDEPRCSIVILDP